VINLASFADSFAEPYYDRTWALILPASATIEHVFESMLDAAPPGEEVGQIPAAQCAPSGWTSLELDYGTADPARLSDSELIDTIVGFERAASWASARQAILLAEFARRRPDLEPPPGRSDVPARHSGYAPDEVALALRLSRSSAANRLTMAQVLGADLPATLDAWEQGSIDSAKARAIAEASYRLPPQRRAALEARVLPRAGEQTLARLRAALARAVLALDPDGAHARYQHCYQQRRVVVTPEEDGMAGLWALLSAPDATAVHRRLGDLARDLGADDPRGMDARRADLLVDLLTGRRSAAAQLDDPAPAGTRRPHTSRPGKPLISVITPITMLLGLDEQPAELVGYGPIPAPLARQIAAEGTWRRLLTEVNISSYTRSVDDDLGVWSD
jgi:hypothetical protein